MEKVTKIVIISTIIGLLLIFGIAYLLTKPMFEKEKLLQEWCDNNKIDDLRCPNTDLFYICFNDCNRLGESYFRLHILSWGSTECICQLNNQTNKIW